MMKCEVKFVHEFHVEMCDIFWTILANFSLLNFMFSLWASVTDMPAILEITNRTVSDQLISIEQQPALLHCFGKVNQNGIEPNIMYLQLFLGYLSTGCSKKKFQQYFSRHRGGACAQLADSVAYIQYVKTLTHEHCSFFQVKEQYKDSINTVRLRRLAFSFFLRVNRRLFPYPCIQVLSCQVSSTAANVSS